MISAHAKKVSSLFSMNLKDDFPLLKNSGIVYLDSAATSQKPESVIRAADRYYRTINSNIHRGVYRLAEKATEAYEESHKAAAKFIGAEEWNEIIFTRNATEAINLVAYSWGRSNVKESDVIVLTEMEHHSNLIPWQILAKEKGAFIKFIPVDDNGELLLAEFEKILKEGNVKIVSAVHISNFLGTVNPVEEIVRLSHENGALALIDGAQSIPHMRVNVKDTDCDFLAFSGHKMLGPTGIGVLYGKKEILEEMPPFLAGGDMILDVNYFDATYNELPWKFEAGTPAIAEGIALRNAFLYLERVGMETIKEYEKKLVSFLYESLHNLTGITIYGPPPEKRSGLVSFNIEGIHPHDLATVLDRYNIAIRAGHHCVYPLHKKLGISASARASVYIYNDFRDIDSLIIGINRAKNIFG